MTTRTVIPIMLLEDITPAALISVTFRMGLGAQVHMSAILRIDSRVGMEMTEKVTEQHAGSRENALLCAHVISMSLILRRIDVSRSEEGIASPGVIFLFSELLNLRSRSETASSMGIFVTIMDTICRKLLAIKLLLFHGNERTRYDYFTLLEL